MSPRVEKLLPGQAGRGCAGWSMIEPGDDGNAGPEGGGHSIGSRLRRGDVRAAGVGVE